MSDRLDIVFAGTPAFAVPALQALRDSRHRVVAVYTQPDRPAGRGRKLQASPVKQCAQAADIPVHQPVTLKDADVQAELAALQPDVMVVVAYGLILPQAVLDIPRHGCLNIHGSLLPRWRGAAPIQRAILAGDAETGVTIMQMAAGLDTGPMLIKKRCPIDSDDNTQRLHDQLAALGAEALLETLDLLCAGRLQPEAQNEALANYASKLDKAEALLDWRQDARALLRQVKAFNPWPVAQTTYNGETLRVWDAALSTANTNAAPGSVIHADKQGIDVATGAGVLRLTQVQLPGGRAQTAGDLLNAHPQMREPGVVLG